MKHQTTAIPLDSILGAEVGTAKLGDKISVTIPYGGYGFDSNGIKHRITDVENAIITRKTRYRVYCLDLDRMWSFSLWHNHEVVIRPNEEWKVRNDNLIDTYVELICGRIKYLMQSWIDQVDKESVYCILKDYNRAEIESMVDGQIVDGRIVGLTPSENFAVSRDIRTIREYAILRLRGHIEHMRMIYARYKR